jgi:dTDP-4-amino-4,6-dideoxygalactose transaminase
MSEPTRGEYIVFGKPDIGEAEIAEVVDSLRKGWPGSGPKVARFEQDFRAYLGAGADHALAVHSCTAALFLAQLSLGIGAGDAVVTTPLTFVATASSIRHVGARPLFADVDASTGLLDPSAVERLLVEDCTIDPADGRPVHKGTGTKVRALLPVHLWGQAVDVPRFRALCERFNLKLIEDAAHAIEATSAAGKVGVTADVTCFSFYSTKNICTGEGGMLTTADGKLADRARILAQHGLSRDAWKRFSDDGYRHYLALESGWKFNMMDLQAGMGIHQLRRIDAMGADRERQWRAYLAELAGLPIGLPKAEAPHGKHARHLFTLRVDGRAGIARDDFMAKLHGLGVGAGIHYIAVTEHPAFAGAANVPVPNAERIGRETVSIPLGGALKEEQRRRVVQAIRTVLGAGRMS